jgi:hypothetical protein
MVDGVSTSFRIGLILRSPPAGPAEASAALNPAAVSPSLPQSSSSSSSSPPLLGTLTVASQGVPFPARSKIV